MKSRSNHQQAWQQPEVLPGVAATFVRLRCTLAGFVRCILDRPHEVENVLQDVYIKAVKMGECTDIRNRKAFLFKVCRNLALKEHFRAFNRLFEALEDFESSSVLHGSYSLDH